MMTITDKQLMKISEIRMNGFIRQTSVFLRSTYAQEVQMFNDKELTEWIREGIANAKEYEIEEEDALIQYIVLMVKHGKEFDKEPWAKRILRSASDDLRNAFLKLNEKSEALITKNSS